MIRTLNEEALINVIWGATLLGGGGGGSLQSGLDMLEAYKKAHPEKAPELELITYDEMLEGEYAAVTAGMGSPQAIVGLDFSQYAINAFELLQEMAKREGKNLKYSIPVELGGFNTFVPMLISLVKGISFVDADGAGRAVPALETLAKKGIVEAKVIGKGKVEKVFTDMSGGFDYGYVLVKGEDDADYKVDFQNENLLVSKGKNGTFTPLMTVPDITCMYCIQTIPGSPVKAGMPVSNADVKEGMVVGIGAIKVNEKWFKDENHDKKWWTVWKEYMDNINYTGENIPFDHLK